MSSLKFGTSGLRGLVTDLLGWPSFAYTSAFLRSLETTAGNGARREVLIGRDLRASSGEIAGACMAAAASEGWTAFDGGALPTPALALGALARGCPAVMITGSHIPDDRNGLKFYTAAGEITKADEGGILAALESVLAEAGAARTAVRFDSPDEVHVDPSLLSRYLDRYTGFFAPDCLAGLTVGIYQHSTVARDLLPEIVSALGGTPLPFARSDRFVPVDTEAHRPEDLALLADFAASTRIDAILSADGDADRPLIADANGRVVRGDVVGLLTALDLGVGTIVTPVTSSSSIERVAAPARIVRTRVGSPYVIAGIEAAVAAGPRGVIGFEANGGVLLGSDIVRDGRMLPCLATRDAVLPSLCLLSAIRRQGQPLAEIVERLGIDAAAAFRLEKVASSDSARLLSALAGDPVFARSYFGDFGEIADVDALDGVRTRFADGKVVHYRASGNAPELRCYVEAEDEPAANALLAAGLDKAARFLGIERTSH